MLYSCFTKGSTHQEDSKRGDQLSRIVGELYLIGDEIDGCFNEDWLVDWSFG